MPPIFILTLLGRQVLDLVSLERHFFSHCFREYGNIISHARAPAAIRRANRAVHHALSHMENFFYDSIDDNSISSLVEDFGKSMKVLPRWPEQSNAYSIMNVRNERMTVVVISKLKHFLKLIVHRRRKWPCSIEGFWMLPYFSVLEVTTV